MKYGIIDLNIRDIKTLVETIDFIEFAYPIPRNLREREEKRLLPRFYEIQDAITAETSLPDRLSIQVSKINYDDILYGLESSSISKILKDKGLNIQKLKEKLTSIEFLPYSP